VKSDNRIRVALYTQQSFVAQGLAAVFRTHADLELTECRDSLTGTLECLKSTRPDVLLVYLLSGVTLSELREIRSADSGRQVVLWGQGLEGEFAFQAIRLGVRSILAQGLKNKGSPVEMPSLYLMARKQPTVAVAQQEFPE
jgi:DNA-binding NarL/FixJ family response regulator